MKTYSAPKFVAEFLGSMILVVAAISPTILMFNVLKSDFAVAVLADGLAVGFVLFALVETLGPVSGCHINPAVTIAKIVRRDIDMHTGFAYTAVQFAGGLVGLLCSYLMFTHEVPVLFTIFDIARPTGCYFAEFFGTMMLVVVYTAVRKAAQNTLAFVSEVIKYVQEEKKNKEK